MSKANEKHDLYERDSKWVRVDGAVPFNGCLWDTESWWPSHDREMGGGFHRFHFGIVALADGRYATEGVTWALDANSTIPSWRQQVEGPGEPVIFEDRIKAIRCAAARMLRTARWSRTWGYEGLKPEQIERLFNWTLKAVSEATDKKAWKPVKVFGVGNELPFATHKTGMELFDYAKVAMS